MSVLAKVRYRLDESQPIIETQVIDHAGKTVTENDLVPIHAAADTMRLRNIHTALLWRVDSQRGGFLETFREGAEEPDYVHPHREVDADA